MTFEDAQAKVASESRSKTNYFRLTNDGDYRFRVLPIAPDLVEGKWVQDRKGYEYPLVDYMLMFTKEGQKKPSYVSVIDTTQVFPNVEKDLIKVYYDKAVAECGDDKKTIEALGNITSKGGAGLRPSFRRCMYVIDQENPNDIAMLQLSNAQYRDLETLKMSTWKELRSDDPKAVCPLTHPVHGYDVLATKKSSPKTTITFSLSRKEVPVSEKMLDTLINMDRIPTVIYRYTRFHLEATVAYLQDIDEKFGFNFMETGDNGEFVDKEINSAYQQIKLSLPADDHSHFDRNASNDDDDDVDNTEKTKTLAELEKLVDQYKDEQSGSEKFQDVKEQLMDFIDANELDFQVRRFMSLTDILDGIKDELEQKNPKADEVKADDDEAPEAADQNPDTAEPATRPARRRRQ